VGKEGKKIGVAKRGNIFVLANLECDVNVEMGKTYRQLRSRSGPPQFESVRINLKITAHFDKSEMGVRFRNDSADYIVGGRTGGIISERGRLQLSQTAPTSSGHNFQLPLYFI
jgi:hypothetical protein